MSLRTPRLTLGAACVLTAVALGAGPVAATDDDSLVIGIMSEPASLSLADSYAPQVQRWLYNALYTMDESLSPVPDIADEMPEISEDGLVWTVRLREDVYFQPTGEQLTAEDVVFTYQLANSLDCSFEPSSCLAYVTVTPEGADEPVKVLQDVEAVDDFTVRFTLAETYAPFGTGYLTGLWIISKDAAEAQFAEFQKEAADVAAADVAALVAAGVGSETFSSEAEALIVAAGLDLPDKALHQSEDGTSYTTALEFALKDLSTILNAEEIDQMAAASKHLDTIGTGPFHVTEWRHGLDITAVPNELYHHGPAALETLYFVFIDDDVAGAMALAAGDIDWKPSLTADGYAQVEGDSRVKFARYQDFGYLALQFNLRPGRLFHERAVRQALAYCFDKPATVEVATDGMGLPIYSDILPTSWAYNHEVPRYEHDVEKGKAILEEAGWIDTDGDGVREKDGRPLHSNILLRAGKSDRTKFMRLLAEQVRDCGFDLTTEEASFQAILMPGLSWPLIMTGQTEQWDAYFGGWGTWWDPDPFFLWHSSQCVTEEQPELYNYVCFQNERVDELIMAGLRETDQAVRAPIYQEYAMIMAEELPYLWAWSDVVHEGLAVSVHGAEEWTEDVMDNFFWHWQHEQIQKENPADLE